VLADICAHGELAAVASKVLLDVASVMKAVHDVGELRGVGEPKRVTGLMDAGEVDDRIAQELVWDALGGSDDVDLGPEYALDQDGTRLPIEGFAAASPVDADVRGLA
jgi:hypothetical protein